VQVKADLPTEIEEKKGPKGKKKKGKSVVTQG
jgi:hypothetical protein